MLTPFFFCAASGPEPGSGKLVEEKTDGSGNMHKLEAA
jgi:hypothetical protein